MPLPTYPRAEPVPDGQLPSYGAADWWEAMGNLYSATVAENDAVRSSISRETLLREVYQKRIDAIKAATGAEIDNPFLDDNADGVASGGLHPLGMSVPPGTAAIRWALRTQDLARKFPAQADLILGKTSVEEEAADLARQKSAALDAALADPRLGGAAKTAASLAGGLMAAPRDPLQLGMMAAGGGLFGTGKTVLGTAVRVGASEAVVGAATEVAQQPFEQANRQRLGLEYGVNLAAENVAMAAGMGAALGAAGGAIGRAFGWIGDPAVAKAARVAAEDDVAAFGDVPAGLTPDEAGSMAAQAVGAVEHPTEMARPVGPVQKPARPPDVARVVDETLPGETTTVQGREAIYTRFDPAGIETDAAAFQYKDGGDAQGVTERLKGVQQWDPMASGKVFVYEANDGRKVIADGHQRLGLARRLADSGQDVKLDGFLFREADGWTVPDVRALAAKKNLQEGSGTSLDAARILRDRPDILDDALPTTGPMMRRAQGLARLSEDGWKMTVNGLVPEGHAALVGEMVPNPADHVAVLADLKRFSPETEREARLLVQEVLSSGVVHEQQEDMFGLFDTAKSLMGERVKVLDAAMQQLRSDKRIFGELSKNAELIEAAGNQLDRMGNRSKALSADFMATLLEKMARSKGEMSDALTEAAKAMQGGASRAAAAKAFMEDVKAIIGRHGFGKLMAEADAPAPVLKPSLTVEPATAEATRLAEAAAPIAPTAIDDAPTLWDALPLTADAEGPSVRAADLLADATRTDELAQMAELCTMA